MAAIIPTEVWYLVAALVGVGQINRYYASIVRLWLAITYWHTRQKLRDRMVLEVLVVGFIVFLALYKL